MSANSVYMVIYICQFGLVFKSIASTVRLWNDAIRNGILMCTNLPSLIIFKWINGSCQACIRCDWLRILKMLQQNEMACKSHVNKQLIFVLCWFLVEMWPQNPSDLLTHIEFSINRKLDGISRLFTVCNRSQCSNIMLLRIHQHDDVSHMKLTNFPLVCHVQWESQWLFHCWEKI